MFCPHYRRYRGNTTELIPITALGYRGFTALINADF